LSFTRKWFQKEKPIIKKTAAFSKENPVGKSKNDINRFLINILQFNQEIRNTYIKRIGNKYIIKWLHGESRGREEILAYQEVWSKFNQLLELRDALFRSNLNLLALITTIDKITIDDDVLVAPHTKPYPIEMLNELSKFMYFWKHFNSLVNDELDESMWERRLPKAENWGNLLKNRPRWERFNEGKKIIHTLLWTIHEAVLKRVKMFWRNDIHELKENEDYCKFS
jgi:hypothetical protein